jgi:hypothetical protein
MVTYLNIHYLRDAVAHFCTRAVQNPPLEFHIPFLLSNRLAALESPARGDAGSICVEGIK